jgi:glycosyltransferase involved in cell wall biosynthesis
MKKVDISVVMPCYNAESFLAKSIDSVLNQSYKNFELIVVDDGSTDGSNSILKSYQQRDSRIVLLTQENLGIVSALNRGLEFAVGKYCARMDADDISLPDRFLNQYRFLENNPDVYVLGGQGYVIDEDDDLICPLSVVTEHLEIDNDLLNYFNRRAIIHPSVMFRTDEVIKIGGYRENFIWAEDLDLFLRVSEVGKLANLDSVVIYYRKHGNSISDKKSVIQRSNAIKATTDARTRRGIPLVCYKDLDVKSTGQSRLNY